MRPPLLLATAKACARRSFAASGRYGRTGAHAAASDREVQQVLTLTTLWLLNLLLGTAMSMGWDALQLIVLQWVVAMVSRDGVHHRLVLAGWRLARLLLGADQLLLATTLSSTIIGASTHLAAAWCIRWVSRYLLRLTCSRCTYPLPVRYIW